MPCLQYGLVGFDPLVPGVGGKLALPMLIIGVALVVTGIVLLIKPKRFRAS
jgi:hypothetical protein